MGGGAGRSQHLQVAWAFCGTPSDGPGRAADDPDGLPPRRRWRGLAATIRSREIRGIAGPPAKEVTARAAVRRVDQPRDHAEDKLRARSWFRSAAATRSPPRSPPRAAACGKGGTSRVREYPLSHSTSTWSGAAALAAQLHSCAAICPPPSPRSGLRYLNRSGQRRKRAGISVEGRRALPAGPVVVGLLG